ncbi:MAG: sugar O-acetyltransferase [Beduini sp.]|mgnify:CR=1 FL=1|uniref:sugar O-acetyltransferase n=1 Tax=Beduini sp. TaxID=1922300 RepID=UPI0011C8C000
MDLNDMKERMLTGKLYLPNDESIMNEQALCLEKQYDFNATRPMQKELRQTLLKDMLASIGENCYIEPPLHANWGGKRLHLGNNVYANFNLTLVDDVEIYIDDYVMIGPNVTIATGTHPILPDLRLQAYQYNMPVHIKKNVWLGAGCIVLPGVTIGENTVIGAGSVVTKDIPANVVAAGTPCRVLREINDHDKQYYYKDRKIDL